MKTKPFEVYSVVKVTIVAAILSAAISTFCPASAVWAEDGPGEDPGEVQAVSPPPIDEDGPRFGGERGGQKGDRMRKRFREYGQGENQGGPGGQGGGDGMGRMGRAGRFLGFVSEFNKQVQDPVQSVGLAAVGVKEYYRREGKPEDAVPVLEEMLKSAKDQRVRNVLLFAMRQIYEETKSGTKMLELSKQIMRENIAAVDKK